MEIKDPSLIESMELREEKAKERLKNQMDRYKSKESSLKSESDAMGRD